MGNTAGGWLVGHGYCRKNSKYTKKDTMVTIEFTKDAEGKWFGRALAAYTVMDSKYAFIEGEQLMQSSNEINEMEAKLNAIERLSGGTD